MSEFSYVGSELEIFEGATEWKGYLRKLLIPYIQGNVLEVGSGIGGTTALLSNQGEKSWMMLEPDAKLCGVAQDKIRDGRISGKVSLIHGTLGDLPESDTFDAIFYVDVLEHIENDADEMAKAASRLAPSGRLVVVAPAHQFLFSPFDQAIGHFRRYNKRSLRALTPAGLKLSEIFYADAVGFFASAMNRLLLQQSQPSVGQIQTWDKLMVPMSRLFDPIFGYQFGKTIVAVWEKGKDAQA